MAVFRLFWLPAVFYTVSAGALPFRYLYPTPERNAFHKTSRRLKPLVAVHAGGSLGGSLALSGSIWLYRALSGSIWRRFECWRSSWTASSLALISCDSLGKATVLLVPTTKTPNLIGLTPSAHTPKMQQRINVDEAPIWLSGPARGRGFNYV